MMTFAEISVLLATMLIPAILVVLVLSSFLSVRRLSSRVTLLESALTELSESPHGDPRLGR